MLLEDIDNKTNQLDELKRENPDNRYEIDNIKNEISDLRRRYDNLKRSTIASREARVALNEYAPGQTVVIGE